MSDHGAGRWLDGLAVVGGTQGSVEYVQREGNGATVGEWWRSAHVPMCPSAQVPKSPCAHVPTRWTRLSTRNLVIVYYWLLDR